MGFLARPASALWLGLAIAGAAFGLWVIESPGDWLGLCSFLFRFLHIGAAMLWIGMIWFVNFIGLVALGRVDEASREAILRHVALPVAVLFRTASHVVVLTGGGLLLTTGYMLDRWVFPSAVYIPSMRGALLWGGVLAAVAMWGLVHGMIGPNLKLIVDRAGGPAQLAAASEKVRLAARINLVLAVPVTFAMVAAAHLY